MSVKELREKTGLSQKAFAEVVGIPLSSLQHWEQGVNKPSAYLVILIEKALKYDKVL